MPFSYRGFLATTDPFSSPGPPWAQFPYRAPIAGIRLCVGNEGLISEEVGRIESTHCRASCDCVHGQMPNTNIGKWVRARYSSARYCAFT